MTLARFINACGFFVVPFLSLYLTVILKIDLPTTGLCVGLVQAAILPGSLIGGKFADKYGRKTTLITGNLIAVVWLAAAAFASGYIQLTLCLVLFRAFQSCTQPACDAIVADLAAADSRQIAYSFPYMGSNLGMACGTLLGGLLFEHAPALLFLCNIVCILGMVAVIHFGLSETLYNKNAATTAGNAAEKAVTGSALRILISRPNLLIISIMLMVLELAFSQNLFLLPLQMQRLFPGHGATGFSSLMIVNTILCAFATAPVVGATKKLGALKNISLAIILMALGFTMYGLVSTMGALVVATIFWSFGEILLFSNFGSYIANHSPISHRSRMSATATSIGMIGFWLGPMISGRLAAVFSFETLWFAAGTIAISSLLLVPFVNKAEKITNQGYLNG